MPELIEDLLIRLHLPELSRLDVRALFWECLHSSVQENRHRLSIHRDEFVLPFNEKERSERRAELKGVLTKVVPHAYSGLLDPAHCMEDDFHDFLMADRLLYYVGPLDCLTRSEEQKMMVPRSRRGKPTSGVSNDLYLALTARVAPEKPTVAVDISTLHLLDHAFMRRGMAMHAVSLMPWSSHELWRQTLMGALYLEPLRDGFSPPDVTDIPCADKAIWKYLEKRCPDRIRPDASGSYPLVTAMEAAITDPEVKQYLICKSKHLKGPAKSIAPRVTAHQKEGPAGTATKTKQVKEKEKKAKAKAKAKAATEKFAKLEKQLAKGGGKGAAAHPAQLAGERAPKIPRALLPNGKAKAPDGTSYCFGFNLGTCPCPGIQPGRKCPGTKPGSGGLHKCCFEGCGANHPLKGNH